MTAATEQAATLGTLAGVFLVAILTQYHAWKNQQATKSVKQSLDNSTERRDRSLAMIHALVNSGKAALLEKLMDSTSQVARLTPDDKAAQARADWAKRDYDNHMSQQGAIDLFFAQKDAENGAATATQTSPTPNINTQPKGP